MINKFIIGYGSLNALDYKIIEGVTEEQASQEAYRLALEDLESYRGLHGILDFEETKEENPDCDDEEIERIMQEEAESWVNYTVIPWTQEKEDKLIQ